MCARDESAGKTFSQWNMVTPMVDAGYIKVMLDNTLCD